MVLKQMDTNGDGEISYEEFAEVMSSHFYRKYNKDEVRAAFK
jgi:Ca2+-binding EF-hand superfamily protein